jgi:hypothetical protein
VQGNIRFNSALERYTAAVCAAGPEPMTIPNCQYISRFTVAVWLPAALLQGHLVEGGAY